MVAVRSEHVVTEANIPIGKPKLFPTRGGIRVRRFQRILPEELLNANAEDTKSQYHGSGHKVALNTERRHLGELVPRGHRNFVANLDVTRAFKRVFEAKNCELSEKTRETHIESISFQDIILTVPAAAA